MPVSTFHASGEYSGARPNPQHLQRLTDPKERPHNCGVNPRLVDSREDAAMGSSEKYWQYARYCAKWAKETNKGDDKDILERMAKAWAHVARAERDVARDASLEPEGRLHS